MSYLDTSGGLAFVDNHNTTVSFLAAGQYRLSKTGGVNGAADADAISATAISGRRILWISLVDAAHQAIFGFSSSVPASGSESASVPYATILHGGSIFYSENGGSAWAYIGAAYSLGEYIGLRVNADNTISMLRNSSPSEAGAAVVYTSTATFTGPLYGRVTLVDSGDSALVAYWPAEAPAISASASMGPGALQSAAAGKAVIKGAGGGTLNAFGTASEARVRVKAAASPAPVLIPGSSVARARIKAASNFTLGQVLGTAPAKALIEGSGSGTLAAFGAAAAGKVRNRASAGPSLASVTTTGAIGIRLRGAADPALNAFVVAASAETVVSGGALTALAGFGGVSAVKVRLRGTAGPPLSGFTSTGTVGVTSSVITALGQTVLGPFYGVATARMTIRGASAAEMNPLAGTAAGRLRARAAAVLELGAFQAAGTIRRVLDVETPPRRSGRIKRADRAGTARQAFRSGAIDSSGRAHETYAARRVGAAGGGRRRA